PQVAHGGVLFAPRPMRDHRRRPGDEPEAQQERRLGADVNGRPRPEDASRVPHSRQTTDVAHRHPAVLTVPHQNGQAAQPRHAGGPTPKTPARGTPGRNPGPAGGTGPPDAAQSNFVSWPGPPGPPPTPASGHAPHDRRTSAW